MPESPVQPPQDPFGEMAAGAVEMHEMYVSYVHAGFTPEQAFQIVLTLLVEYVRKA